MTRHLDVPARLRDRFVEPGDRRYPLLRSTYTTVAAPAGIVLARGAEDVAATLALARDRRLPLSVRSGGHGLSGRSTNDCGLVIELSMLDEVTVLDRDARLVRIGAGARWGRVAEKLATEGLAISSGDHGNVGVGGLATAGGIGWLVRSYGLTVDHVRAVDLVLPDGTPVRADGDHDPELFWALRGAGGGIGVALAFEIEARELGEVGTAQVVFDADAEGKALQHWGAVLATAPRELTTAAVLVSQGGRPLLVITAVVASDDPERFREALEPLLTGGPEPLHATGVIEGYTSLVSTGHEHPNIGQQPVLTTSALLRAMTPEAARALVRAVTGRNRPFVQLRSLGGAVGDVAADATAFAHRDQQVLTTATLFPPATVDELDAVWAEVREHAEGAYVNFETGTGVDVFRRAYPGRTGERVQATWLRYDPDGLLQPIDTPARARLIAAPSGS